MYSKSKENWLHHMTEPIILNFTFFSEHETSMTKKKYFFCGHLFVIETFSLTDTKLADFDHLVWHAVIDFVMNGSNGVPIE